MNDTFPMFFVGLMTDKFFFDVMSTSELSAIDERYITPCPLSGS
jgi:hypothetical protein